MRHDKLGFFTAVGEDNCLFIERLRKKIFIMLTVAHISGIDIYNIAAAVLFYKITFFRVIYEALNMQSDFLFSFIYAGSRALPSGSGVQPILSQRNIAQSSRQTNPSRINTRQLL
jgi:hypothetical protein